MYTAQSRGSTRVWASTWNLEALWSLEALLMDQILADWA